MRDEDDRTHIRALIAIHERRIRLFEERIKRVGSRDNLPVAQLIELENDEAQVKALKEMLENE